GGNYLFLGKYGYTVTALSIVASYFAMSIASYFIGKKHYPIPYNFKPLVIYTVIFLVTIYWSYQVKMASLWLDSLLNLAIPVAFTIAIYFMERKRIFKPIE
ncbi:hypothetical protein MNBD_BACTEROID06-1125, partial [hydrothermal vent metagenome]